MRLFLDEFGTDILALARWDREILGIELQALIDLDFDLELTGFALAETEIILDEARERAPSGEDEAADDLPPLPEDGKAVTRRGDVWLLGRHRVVCGDAQDGAVLRLAMDGGQADLVFTDPPYNVPIDGHVSGLGRTRHREFGLAAMVASRKRA